MIDRAVGVVVDAIVTSLVATGGGYTIDDMG